MSSEKHVCTSRKGGQDDIFCLKMIISVDKWRLNFVGFGAADHHAEDVLLVVE